MRRLIIEMGQGVDLQGQDYTKAAGRAIDDALRHVSLPVIALLDLPDAQVQIKVTLGVQRPEAVVTAPLAGKFPFGTVEIATVFGGMDVPQPDGGAQVVASAAIEVFLPGQSGWRLRQAPG